MTAPLTLTSCQCFNIVRRRTYEWNLMGQVHPQIGIRLWLRHRERRQTKDWLCEDNEKAMCPWVAPHPGVRDVKFHNAVITRQNLNKAVILTSLLSTFSGKWLMSGPLECVYGRPSTWQNHRQIYELLSQLTSKVRLISSRRSCRCVCSASIILILNPTGGDVLIATNRNHQVFCLCFPQHGIVTRYHTPLYC